MEKTALHHLLPHLHTIQPIYVKWMGLADRPFQKVAKIVRRRFREALHLKHTEDFCVQALLNPCKTAFYIKNSQNNLLLLMKAFM